MEVAGNPKREEHKEISSPCFFPSRPNSAVRGGAREGLKAGGAERAGQRGGVSGSAAAVAASAAGGAAGEQSRHVHGQGRQRWKTKLTSGAHLAVIGVAGPVCQRGRERSESGAGRIFCISELTRRQRVMPAWLATSANVVKMKLKLLSTGKVVDVILKVII